MKRKVREVLLAATLSLLIGACSQKSVDPIELLDTTSPGELEVISVVPIPPEEVGDNRYFYGMLEKSEIDNGGFEEPFGDDGLPVGWAGVLSSPPTSVQDKTIVKLGKYSAKLTGSTEKRTILRTTTGPSSGRLRGKEVVFGMWVYTSHPKKTDVRIIEDWKIYTVESATEANKWELLKVVRVIPKSSKRVLMAVTLAPNDPPVVCYVDGAALLVRDVKQ